MNGQNRWGRNIKEPLINATANKPRLAISRCLLGEQVRYDGRCQHDPQLIEFFGARFELIPVCPEVEIGLGVPRPPVELSGNPSAPRLTGQNNPALDITIRMTDYCPERAASLNTICGYIFKSRSPSCGLYDTPVYRNQQIIHLGAGLFARAIQNAYPQLPLRDELQLQHMQAMEDFSQQLLNYHQNKP